MTGKQNGIMWLGFLLIVTRLFTTGEWSNLWGVISNGPGPGSGTNGTTTVPAAANAANTLPATNTPPAASGYVNPNIFTKPAPKATGG
jgi:hypothetical protein